MSTLFDVVKCKSQQIDPIKTRTVYGIMAHLMSEVGELAQEVAISQGDSYKQHSTDHIIGEAVDVLLCVLDLLHVVDPNITEAQLSVIAEAKGIKWINAVTKHKG
jgi:NTP pyrophosphatase (non-canonical NTP hydrolase)